MPIVPYIRLSEMIMIGLPPYWHRGGDLVAHHQRAAVADKRDHLRARPAQRRRDRHRHARAHRADHRRQEHLALAEADIAVDEAAEIAGVGRHRRVRRQVLVDLADDRGEIDAVARSAPIPSPAACGGSRCSPATQPRRFAASRRRAALQQRLDDLVRARRRCRDRGARRGRPRSRRARHGRTAVAAAAPSGSV